MRPLSIEPMFRAYRSDVFASRKCFQRLPVPGIVFDSDHFTFSCVAAWIASCSLAATTPMKSPLRSTRAPLMFLIELSSTESGLSITEYGPWPRGRTTRPCSMPGSRSWWTYGCEPDTFPGVSFRFTGLPTRRYSVTGFSGALPVFGAENALPPRRAP